MTLKIALWGARTLDNLGDRLIAAITEQALASRLARASFQHYCPWGKDPSALPLSIDSSGSWPGAGKYDAILVVGGGVCAGPPFKHPIMQVFCFGPDPGHFEPGTFLAWSAVGLQDGTPAPTRPSWRAYFDALHERLQYCTVRSEDAAELIAGSNRKNRPAVVPDPVFYLPPLPARLSSRRGKYRLGVALGNPLPAPSFLAALAGPELANRCPFNEATCLHPEDVASLDFSQSQLIRKSHFLPAVLQALRLLGDSVSIEFFGFGAMYGDRELAVQLASCLEGARVATGIPRDVDAMQALIASYDGLVLSRYHAAILALRAGRPFVVADPYWSESTGTSKLHQLMKQAALLQAYWADEASGIAGTGDLTAAITMMMQGEAENGNIYEALHQRCERHFDALAASLLAA